MQITNALQVKLGAAGGAVFALLFAVKTVNLFNDLFHMEFDFFLFLPYILTKVIPMAIFIIFMIILFKHKKPGLGIPLLCLIMFLVVGLLDTAEFVYLAAVVSNFIYDMDILGWVTVVVRIIGYAIIVNAFFALWALDRGNI